jgi:hypothetical protein
MARKTGKDVIVQVEVGTTYYSMAALVGLTTPASEVGKKFESQAAFLSAQEDYQPIVRLDGVVSGLTLTPGSDYNTVDYTAGQALIKGQVVNILAGGVAGFERPVSAAQVIVYALSVDANGTINKTKGVAGASTTVRGAAGGPPFIPVDQALVGYVTMTYFGGAVSGADLIESSEINSESKERANIPSYEVIHHDGAGNDPTNLGCVRFFTALPLIHAATAAGPGTARRNVYASYYEADFEQIPDSKDYSYNEDVTTVKSKAYLDSSEESTLGTPSWTGAGTSYWDKVNDVLSMIKNTKRWLKIFPDKDETAYVAGRAVIKVSRTMPVGDNMTAAVTLEGSGSLYHKTS